MRQHEKAKKRGESYELVWVHALLRCVLKARRAFHCTAVALLLLCFRGEVLQGRRRLGGGGMVIMVIIIW